MPLLHLVNASEVLQRVAPCGFWIESARPRIVFGELEVRDHFVIELALEAIDAEQRKDPGEAALQGHALASRIRATSAAACCQLATSMCSCFAPARVSE